MQNEQTASSTQGRGGAGTGTSGSTGTGTQGTTGTSGSGAGESVLDQAKGTAQQLASTAGHQAKREVRGGVARGKDRAADSLHELAQSLRGTGDQLRQHNQGELTPYVDQAAGRVDQLADYLQNTDVSEMLDGVERFARREPALFLGGAFVLGLLGSRFLKSSRRNEQASRNAGAYRYGGQRYGNQYGSQYAGQSGAGFHGEMGAGSSAGAGAVFNERDVTARANPSGIPADRAPFTDTPTGFGSGSL